MIGRKFIFSVLAIFSMGYANAENCMNADRKDLEACSARNFQGVDLQLNAGYKGLMSGLNGDNSRLLLENQRLWIKYKDNHCQLDGEGGAEASLDRYGCLIKVTKLRVNEIEYLKDGIGMFGFFSYVSLSAKKNPASSGNIVESLNSDFNASDEDLWKKYVEGNCGLTHRVLSESHERCVARMEFYSN